MRVIDVHNNKITEELDCSLMTRLSKVDISDNQYDRLIAHPQHTAIRGLLQQPAG